MAPTYMQRSKEAKIEHRESHSYTEVMSAAEGRKSPRDKAAPVPLSRNHTLSEPLLAPRPDGRNSRAAPPQRVEDSAEGFDSDEETPLKRAIRCRCCICC
jgi:hypothetical protein